MFTTLVLSQPLGPTLHTDLEAFFRKRFIKNAFQIVCKEDFCVVQRVFSETFWNAAGVRYAVFKTVLKRAAVCVKRIAFSASVSRLISIYPAGSE